MACIYNGKTYSVGSYVCQNGREYRCDTNGWAATGYNCSAADGEEIPQGQRGENSGKAPDTKKEG